MTLMAPAVGLAAVVAVVLDGFAQFVFRASDAVLAIIRFGAWNTRKENEAAQHSRDERCLAKQRLPQMM